MGYDSFRCKQCVVTFCCVLVHDRFIYSDYYDRVVTFFFLYSVISCEGVNIMLRFDSVLRSICYSEQSQFRVSCKMLTNKMKGISFEMSTICCAIGLRD